MRKRVLTAAVVLLLGLGCSRSTNSGGERPARTPPAPGRTAVIGVLSDIQGWNPYLTETAHSDDVLRLIYPSLAVELVDYWDHPPTFNPSLARWWEFSEDHLSLTFHLDDKAIWSDGTPVTAEDVVYSYRCQTSEEVGWPDAVIKDYIEAVEAVDAKTVRFRFTHVYPYQLMDANDGLIVPAHAWSQIPYSEWRNTDWLDQVLSAGPFDLGSHTPRQEVVLQRNSSYWKEGRPWLDKVVWRVVPNQANLLTQLRAGAIDFMKGIPPREAEKMRRNPDLHLISYLDRGYLQIIWNLENPLFSDTRVRRALSMAINTQTLISTVYRGFARPAVGPVLSGMWAFNKNLEPLDHSPENARELLAEAGWKDSDGDGVLDRNGRRFEFELMSNSENQTRQDVCILVQQQLQKVGVKAKPRFVEWGTQLSHQRDGTFEAAVHRWLEPTQVDLEDLWHSPPDEGPTLNYGRFANAEVDRLIELANAAPDIESQKPFLNRIQEIIVEEQPYTFLVESVRLDGLSSRVHGAVINNATPYFNLDEWTLDPDPNAEASTTP